MAFSAHDLAEQLRAERACLRKADDDIEAGRKRLQNQEHLVEAMRGGGHDTVQAERLVGLLRQTLLEWERHRVLIEQRVTYLEGQAGS